MFYLQRTVNNSSSVILPELGCIS